jgi:hypothetical protein
MPKLAFDQMIFRGYAPAAPSAEIKTSGLMTQNTKETILHKR